jgi:hypothetical protein
MLLAACVALTTGITVPPDPRWEDASGELRVLVIRATWGPRPTAPGDFSLAKSFYERASLGRLKLDIDITPWVNAYDEPVCATTPNVGPRAQTAARVAGYDAGAYGRLVYLFPERTCSPGGLGIGREVFLATDAGVLDDMALVHELGHTFGLPHATSRRSEYGDPFSPMGHGGLDFSALEKLKLRWISSVRHVDRTGTYSIAPIDESSSGPQALVVTTSSGEYWIERRTKAPRLIVRLVRPDNFISPVYLRSVYLGQAEQRYVARDLFSVSRDGAFRWLDRKRPSAPKVRALDHTVLSWSRSSDGGSGVASYRVTLDGKPLTITTQTSTDLPPLREGGHRVTVVAVDHAGNRSKPGVANLNV